VAKGGPAGILWEEPGAAFVRIRVSAAFGPVLARETAVPAGGLLTHLGTLTRLLEQWRERHLAARTGPYGQIAPEVGIGAVRGGLPAKPDLLPGVVELHLYVVTVPGDDAAEIATGLRRHLLDGVRHGPLDECAIAVDSHLTHPAGTTQPDAAIVGHTTAAWIAAHNSPPPPITGWKGSTDGVVLRGHGVDTVRLGPRGRPDPADPRGEVFELAALVAFARIYADIALRHALTASVDTKPF
jgi:acetylornithine deacetylase/succinyl-diaminopimelate desuccinylase-like protein